MNFLKKRETPSQNIAFISVIASLNIIFVALTTLLPMLSLLLIFVLPLLSVLVWIYCQKKYFLIYSVSTIALSSLLLIVRLTDSLFYLIPSIVTGLFFGICIEKKFTGFWTIFISTLIQVGITYALIPLIRLIFGVSLIDVFINTFGLAEFGYKDYLIPVFIFAISLIQTVLTYIVLTYETTKQYKEEKDDNTLVLLLTQLSLILLSIGFAFIYGPVSLLLTGITIYFGSYVVVKIMYERKKTLIILSLVNIVVTFFMFSFLYTLIVKPFGYLLILIYFAIECILVFSNYCLEKSKNKDTMNKE